MAQTTEDTRPVIVGVGRCLRRGGKRPRIEDIPPLHVFVANAVREAAADAAVGSKVTADDVLGAVEAVACPGRAMELVLNVPGFTHKTGNALDKMCALWPNFPGSVAKAAGCGNVDRAELYDTGCSGSMPQFMVNMLAERIADGKLKCGVMAGGELLDTLRKTLGRWKHMKHWADNGGGGEPKFLVEGKVENDISDQETAHDAGMPVMIYPLFEQALRRELGSSLQDHVRSISALTSGLSQVAAERKQGWAAERFSPEQVAEESDGNRYIGFPYTKRMVANPTVDMSAAVLMMSAGYARSLGIPEDRMVYLDGCGDAREIHTFSHRPHLHRSPSLELALRSAFRQAGLGDDLREAGRRVKEWDLYACFPISVGIAARALGLDPEDGARLSQTGGLMFHGGPGANTATHGIAAIVEKLRHCDPGDRGVVYANGGMMTKHSIGVYSTRPGPPKGRWQREHPAVNQERMQAVGAREVAQSPVGVGVVESYTVTHPQIMMGGGGDLTPEHAVVLGTVVDGPERGRRFIATTPKGSDLCRYAMTRDLIGERVSLRTEAGLSTWQPLSRGKL
eukprot:TRINITY_DN10325_c0_g1_i1.p2 TRINITY_DN10325_c0_g1~~TRINITY_DN10325_c0_g1_i1.p2  ORF type:complete len:566 (+),score=182.06 TRINITY_DN10325_c0_g1_i1:61-1758(+)